MNWLVLGRHINMLQEYTSGGLRERRTLVATYRAAQPSQHLIHQVIDGSIRVGTVKLAFPRRVTVSISKP